MVVNFVTKTIRLKDPVHSSFKVCCDVLCTQKQSSRWQSSQQEPDMRWYQNSVSYQHQKSRKLQLIVENEPGAPAMHTIIGYSYISFSSYTVLKIKPFVHIHSLQLGWTCVCVLNTESHVSLSVDKVLQVAVSITLLQVNRAQWDLSTSSLPE